MLMRLKAQAEVLTSGKWLHLCFNQGETLLVYFVIYGKFDYLVASDRSTCAYVCVYIHILLLLSHFSRVRLCVTPSLGFSRQEHWSGLPFPSPMHKSEK